MGNSDWGDSTNLTQAARIYSVYPADEGGIEGVLGRLLDYTLLGAGVITVAVLFVAFLPIWLPFAAIGWCINRLAKP